MKLNLWMIANRLSALEPELHISGNAPAVLSSARRAYATNCVHVYQKGTDTVCAAENDYLLFHDMNCEVVFEMVQCTFDFYREWQDSLEDASQKLDYRSIVDDSWPVFHNPVILLDGSYRVLFMSEQYGENEVNEDWKYLCRHGHSSVEAIQYLLAEGQKNNYYLSGDAQLYHFSGKIIDTDMLSAAIYSGNDCCGRINVIAKDREINSGDVICLNYIVRMLSYVLGRINQEHAFPATQNIFLKMMLQQETNPSELQNWMLYMKWNETDSFHIAVLSSPEETSSEKMMIIYRLLQSLFPDSVVTTCSKKIIVMYRTTPGRKNDIADALCDISQKYRINTGLSLPFTGTQKLHYYYGQAIAAIYYGSLLAPAETLHRFYNYALEHLIRTQSLDEAVCLCHPDVRKLWNPASEDGGEKIKTLFTYLNNDRSLQNTAGELYIHRNTLVYRIHRITESLTCNIDDIYSRDYIKMSIRVLRLYYLNGINSPFLP